MKRVTQSGATMEEAIASALQQLGATREQVTVRVIAEGKKGFLGFGSRPAAVEVTVLESMTEPVQPPVKEVEPMEKTEPTLQPSEPTKPEKPDPSMAIQETEAYILSVAKEMGVDDLLIHTKRQGKNVFMMLESEKVALLIGKRGQTLNALQQLAQLIINKFADQFLIVRLDAENYRERRQETLEQLADKMADKAVRTGHKVHLEPMPPHERKVIHQALSTRLDIETHSEGKEPKRYLVIKPLK